ncbi:MAG: DUF4276 family protein [Prosthecobacter sp.]
MNAIIYLEGASRGPDSNELKRRCREAFSKLLERMGFKGRKPRLVACGGRNSVLDDFSIALRTSRGGYVAMWIDSEEPMQDIEAAWKHLAEVTSVDKWEQPAGARDDQVLFMTTCMETWIVADKNTLRSYYGQHLNESALPPTTDLERRSRHDVQDRLVRATQNCKNAFAKGKRSFEVLEEIKSEALADLPSFARVKRILQEKL